MSSVVERFRIMLQQCGDAMQIERSFHEIFTDVRWTSMLFADESSLSKLASYNCSKGIFW